MEHPSEQDTDPRVQTLAELCDHLRRLLAHLADKAPAPTALRRVREDCDACVARYNRQQQELAAPSERCREELRAALEEVVRLNAVASSLAEREAATIRETLEIVQRARRGVNRAVLDPPTGDTCNVSC